MQTDTQASSTDKEIRRFQDLLDRCFPIGALCVEFVDHDGRLVTIGDELVTGRVICTDAYRSKAGGWRHRLLIDSRCRHRVPTDALEVWVSALQPHHEIPGLWEAAVFSDGSEDRVLRLMADPEPPWRPTPAMRRAVTKAHGVHG
jgi:hypothetical protein